MSESILEILRNIMMMLAITGGICFLIWALVRTAERLGRD